MFGLRTALPGARSLVASTKVSNTSNTFHTSVSALAKPRKSRRDIVIQVRKNNIQKQEKIRLELESSAPDYILGKETDFTRSLLRPESVLQTPLVAIKPETTSTTSSTEDSSSSSKSPGYSFSTSPLSPSIFSSASRTPLVVSTSKPTGYQHFLTEQETDLIFDQVPQVQVQELMNRSTLVNERLQLPIEMQKAELVRRIAALENGNAKQITLENIRRAREAFQRAEGDTGSPEVQAAVMTVRIQNLHSHIQNNKKDKHNYRRLRMLVHQRQTVLKYLKRTYPDRYHDCLDRLGLEPRAIEGEIVI
ncbi:hypothetical protein BG011_008503 [Mortierella polycephala]|uniref:Ribosomal protein S15 n=1 Tax=Mortierella polycephala TaxID=41804 RepID=A0A9P6PR13_9FUNG|nr:hypothetical protein BG011_008503 [Mortierella polycephala]